MFFFVIGLSFLSPCIGIQEKCVREHFEEEFSKFCFALRRFLERFYGDWKILLI